MFAMVLCFSCVFVIFLEAYFMCFICLHTYIASIAYECFESRLSVAYVAMRVRTEGDANGPAHGLVARAPHGHMKPKGRLGRAGFSLCEHGCGFLVPA
jgi:hypothetical protein